MIPVIEIPKIVSEPLDTFTPLLWKRQQKHMREYLTGLIISPKTTISTMNRLFVDGNDQSSLNKFLISSNWNEQAVNDMRLGLLQKSNRTKYKPWGVVVIDDTLSHKTGKRIEGVDKHFDHSEKRYIIGHNLVTSHYADKEISYPIDYRLYHRDGSDMANRMGFKTKIELNIELIHDAVSRNIPVNTFVFDSWFLSKDVSKVINGYNKGYVSRAKCNRIIWIHNNKMNITEYANTVPVKEFKEIKIRDKEYLAYSFVCKMSKLGKVRVCITYEKGKPEDFIFLVTNMLDWEERKILNTYGMRWTIETFYKDAKQELGFEDYQVRKLKGIMRHWYLVFFAYSLLKLGAAKGSLGRWLNAETIGKACRDVIVGNIESLLRWAYEKFKDNVELGGLMGILSIKIAKV